MLCEMKVYRTYTHPPTASQSHSIQKTQKKFSKRDGKGKYTTSLEVYYNVICCVIAKLKLVFGAVLHIFYISIYTYTHEIIKDR